MASFKIDRLQEDMLRELTAVTALFAACEMVLGVFLFAMCNLDAAAPATSTTAAPYVWFVTCFLGNPLVIILNLGALAAAIFHAITWFNLMPKAVRLFMNKNSTELLPSYVVKFGLYGALGGATLVILIFAIATI